MLAAFRSSLQAEELQSRVDALVAEKAAVVESRDEAESRLAALSAELAAACSELETAQHTGTPKGELQAGSSILRQCTRTL